ncbi:MAG TPA: N-acetylmuramoyl-L-alanine amidase [Xanthomonadaceae bacterium]|nr:N-acetylmuramoyl-L-alanine amidase [Xanthomonadaceae bacterium]
MLALAASAAAGAAEIRALRVWDGPEHTRAVFDVSGPVQYKLFTLDNPYRVVLDFDGAALAGEYAGAEPEGVIRRVRTGARGKGDTRVVLDLVSAARPRSFLLAPAEQHGHRLVVDLYAEGAAAPPIARTVHDAMTSGERDLVVAVDAGHGGEDPGAIGPSGTHEKQITLAIARELKRQIDAEPGMRAVLIRDRDYFIPLKRRYELARQAKADLFVSIHADAFNKPSAAGSSVFVMSTRGATSEAARWLAERENRSDLVGGVSLGDRDDTLAAVLLDLSQSATMKASEDMARAVLNGLKGLGRVHKAEVQRANFVVLRSPDVPSMLVETAFISNPAEERRLKDAAHQRRLAAAIVGGVRDYFSRQPPPGTWFAAQGAAPAREHVVARGETLSQIAARHRIPLSALRAANRIEGDLVRVGERLRIPGMGPG